MGVSARELCKDTETSVPSETIGCSKLQGQLYESQSKQGRCQRIRSVQRTKAETKQTQKWVTHLW